MLGVAVNRYLSAVDYQKGLPGLRVELVVTSPGPFEARTTLLALPHLRLLRAVENLPRIAHIVVPPSPGVLTFSRAAHPPVLWNGVAMRPGDLVVHASGESLHQRTGAAAAWGMLSVERDFLARHGGAVLRNSVPVPGEAAVLRVSTRDSSEFTKLICRSVEFAEKRPGRAGSFEVAQALEQDLLYALLCCLGNGQREPQSPEHRLRAAVVNQVAAMLAEAPHRRLVVADLRAAIGVSDGVLNACCRTVLGMGPATYMRLYRLSRARAAIMEAEAGSARIADLARRYGFADAGRFAAAYRLAFGELPSATLSRP